MDKRLRWFDEGAAALRRVFDKADRGDELPASADCYACPCCLGLYYREAVASRVLTLEDVPPKALGGRPMLLTCGPCNHGAGRKLDSHAAMQAVGDSFARGLDSGQWRKATSYMDGIPLRGEARMTIGGLLFRGIPRQNAPATRAKFEAALAAHGSSNPGRSFSVTVHVGFEDARARLSLIRAAYLAAFAGLGWTYILQPALRPVREQLRSPDSEILKPYRFCDPTAPRSQRSILVVNDPPELASVAVTMGEFTVFLPGLWDDRDWESVAESFARRAGPDDRLEVNLNGKAVPWPTSPTYLLDG